MIKWTDLPAGSPERSWWRFSPPLLPPAPRLVCGTFNLQVARKRGNNGARTNRCNGGENVILFPLAKKFEARHGCQTQRLAVCRCSRSAGGLERSRCSGGGVLTSEGGGALVASFLIGDRLKTQCCLPDMQGYSRNKYIWFFRHLKAHLNMAVSTHLCRNVYFLTQATIAGKINLVHVVITYSRL